MINLSLMFGTFTDIPLGYYFLLLEGWLSALHSGGRHPSEKMLLIQMERMLQVKSTFKLSSLLRLKLTALPSLRTTISTIL